MRPDDYYFYNNGTATVERNDDKTDNVFIEILPSHRDYKNKPEDNVIRFNDEVVNDRFYKQNYKKGVIKGFNNKRTKTTKANVTENVLGYSYTVTNPDDAKKLFEISATNSPEEFARIQYTDKNNKEKSFIWTDGPRKPRTRAVVNMYPFSGIHYDGNKIKKVTHSHPMTVWPNGDIVKEVASTSPEDKNVKIKLRELVPTLRSQLFYPWSDSPDSSFTRDYTNN